MLCVSLFNDKKEKAEIEIQLQASWSDDWEPVYHADGFGFPCMPVISMEDPGHIHTYHWGLIPHWVKSRADADKLRAQTLNARSETVFENLHSVLPSCISVAW